MTAKDKAKELYEKMYWHFRTKADSDICEQCALIAVDEIIEEVREYCDDNFHQDRLVYWQEVKSEIEKL
jgi:hypothetical protein